MRRYIGAQHSDSANGSPATYKHTSGPGSTRHLPERPIVEQFYGWVIEKKTRLSVAVFFCCGAFVVALCYRS